MRARGGTARSKTSPDSTIQSVSWIKKLVRTQGFPRKSKYWCQGDFVRSQGVDSYEAQETVRTTQRTHEETNAVVYARIGVV